MKERPAIVQSVHEAEYARAQRLEVEANKHAEGEDSALWEQAAIIVGLIKAGESQREIARRLTNARTGEEYTHTHIQRVLKVALLSANDPRPRFRSAYNEVANAKPKGSEPECATGPKEDGAEATA